MVQVRLKGVTFQVNTAVIIQVTVFKERTPFVVVDNFCRQLLAPSYILKMEATDP